MIIGDKKIIVVDNDNIDFGDRLKEKGVVFKNYYERYYLIKPTGEEKEAKEFNVVYHFPYNIISANIEACYVTGNNEYTTTPSSNIACKIIRGEGQITVEWGEAQSAFDKALIRIIYTN